MGAVASQITSLTIVYSTVYSDADQRKHQSSASLAFVRGIHRGPVNSPHKWPVTPYILETCTCKKVQNRKRRLERSDNRGWRYRILNYQTKQNKTNKQKQTKKQGCGVATAQSVYATAYEWYKFAFHSESDMSFSIRYICWPFRFHILGQHAKMPPWLHVQELFNEKILIKFIELHTINIQCFANVILTYDFICISILIYSIFVLSVLISVLIPLCCYHSSFEHYLNPCVLCISYHCSCCVLFIYVLKVGD